MKPGRWSNHSSHSEHRPGYRASTHLGSRYCRASRRGTGSGGLPLRNAIVALLLLGIQDHLRSLSSRAGDALLERTVDDLGRRVQRGEADRQGELLVLLHARHEDDDQELGAVPLGLRRDGEVELLVHGQPGQGVLRDALGQPDQVHRFFLLLSKILRRSSAVVKSAPASWSPRRVSEAVLRSSMVATTFSSTVPSSTRLMQCTVSAVESIRWDRFIRWRRTAWVATSYSTT